MAQHVYRHICVLQHISIKGCSGTQSTVRGFSQQPDTQHTVVRHCKSCCGVLSRSTWISVGLVWMFFSLIMIFTLPTGAVAKYCDEYVCSACLSVCLSVCEDISGTTHAIFTKFFMHVACVCGSVLLHVYDRLHRLSPGRVFFPIKNAFSCNCRYWCHCKSGVSL